MTWQIKFILMVNKQGQTRLAQYYQYMTVDERAATEAEIIRKCLARNEMQVHTALYHCSDAYGGPWYGLIDISFAPRSVPSPSIATSRFCPLRFTMNIFPFRVDLLHQMSLDYPLRKQLSTHARLLFFGTFVIFSHHTCQVIYRRYASLFFIVGVDSDNENELAVLEFIHALVSAPIDVLVGALLH